MIGYHYFMPGPRLPPQPQIIVALLPDARLREQLTQSRYNRLYVVPRPTLSKSSSKSVRSALNNLADDKRTNRDENITSLFPRR